MKGKQNRRRHGLSALAAAGAMLLLAGTALAQRSLYVIADHSSPFPVNAYDIKPDGSLEFQATYSLPGSGDAGDLVVFWDPNGDGDCRDSRVLVTAESSGKIHMFSAVDFSPISTVDAPGASNLAGIVVDQGNGLIYTVDRRTNRLFVYDANLTAQGALPILLAGGLQTTGAWGLALDETTGLLYVADTTSSVRYYSTSDWSYQGALTVANGAVGVAVDSANQLLYSGGASTGGCCGVTPGDNLLAVYDLASGTTNSIDIAAQTGVPNRGVMGLVVDPDTSYVYITTGCSGDDVRAYDSGLNEIYVYPDPDGTLGDSLAGVDISAYGCGYEECEDCDHPGCNWVDNQIELTANEPTYWSALTGRPKGVSPFTVLDPCECPGRPDPDGSDERVLRGYVLAWAVNADGDQIRWNHLKGDAVLVNYQNGSAWEYNANAFQVHGVEHNEVVGTAGALNLDGVDYDIPFDRLLLDFYAVGSLGLSGAGWDIVADTDLTLLPLDIDLTQDREYTTVTKAKFDIWNMNEWKFSGTERCIECWDQRLLSNYDPPNHFLLQNLGTAKGKARIDGVASSVCPDSVDTPLVGVSMKMLTFVGAADTFAQAGFSLVGMGRESAVITYDPIGGPPPEKRFLGSSRWTKGSLDKGAGATVSCDLPRTSTIIKGSLLIYPKVELRWNASGDVIQDTYLDLTNDYPGDVLVQMYFVNGDPAVAAE